MSSGSPIASTWFAVSLLIASAPAPVSAAAPGGTAGFVRVNGTRLEIEGKPYRFVGANFWQGMNLGASGTRGDRPRLLRELDRLQALGVTNLRILGASEGPDSEPWRVTPSLQPAPGVYDADLLNGLDFLLAEMSKRGMRAVVCLNNFWPWSGGMAQYVRWFGGEPIPYPPPAEGGSWEAFAGYSSRFYSNEPAVRAAEAVTRLLVTRVNSVTGVPYAEDPAIMAWQLANEPRGIRNLDAFDRWLERESRLIKSLDPRHLVTTGSEGETPSPSSAGVDFVRDHRFASIDYATAHVWAQNWGWFDPMREGATYGPAVSRMRAYVADHAAKARKLGKPLVIEEFGLARDLGSHDPASATRARDRYFGEMFEAAFRNSGDAGPVAGVGFWAWSGEARPRAPHGGHWRPGDALLGDPPHEAQGWYGVYDADASTLEVIARHAARMAAPWANGLTPLRARPTAGP